MEIPKSAIHLNILPSLFSPQNLCQPFLLQQFSVIQFFLVFISSSIHFNDLFLILLSSFLQMPVDFHYLNILLLLIAISLDNRLEIKASIHIIRLILLIKFRPHFISNTNRNLYNKYYISIYLLLIRSMKIIMNFQ